MHPTAAAAAEPRDADIEALAIDIFRELIEIDTTDSVGDNTAAAEAMRQRLLAEGFAPEDMTILVPAPRKGNLIVRYRSPAPTAKPILLLAHIDVVEANPEDWNLPPFEFIEQDGWFYGRGTTDNKDEVAIHVANLIRWKREGYAPNRDIIVALTADEEGGLHNGVNWLLDEHFDLVDAAFVINEGGGGGMIQGRRIVNSVQGAEKIYQTFELEVTNRGGHSSVPRKDNAIYQLARALLRIEDHAFPVDLNQVTRAYFRRTAETLPPAQADLMLGLLEEPPRPESIARFETEPAYNSRLRTTCVATMLDAGHAENALPQRAKATVNCRMLPDVRAADVQATLAGVIGDPGVSIRPVQPAKPSPASPLTEEVMAPILDITESMWPGVLVVPTMSTGATDGLYFRSRGIPVYGVSGIFNDMSDIRAHGRDERIMKEAFLDGLEFLNRLTKAYTGE